MPSISHGIEGQLAPDFGIDVAYTMRVLCAYLTTFLVAFFLLLLLAQGSFDEPFALCKRAVLVAFPASFAAATFDYMK